MSTPEPPPYPGEPTPGSPGDLPSYGSVPPPPETPEGGGYGAIPPPPPPAPPSYGPQGFSAPEAIGWGWRKFSQNVGPVLLAVLVGFGAFAVVAILSALMGGTVQFSATPTDPMGMEPKGPADVVAQILGWLVGSLYTATFARAALDVADGQQFDFFDALKRIPVGKVLIAALLVGLATIVGLILLVIPGLIVIFLTYLTQYAVVDQPQASPVDAIKMSAGLIKDNVGQSLLLALLTFLVMVAGFCALCVGLVVAYPVTIFAAANAFRSFGGRPVAP
jgi:uncharacterized membrane protein